MTRNLKTLGLALLAALALTSVVAAEVQAQIKVTTAVSPVWLTGEPIGKTVHLALSGGQTLTCEQGISAATVKNGDTSVTVIPTFLGPHCEIKIGAALLVATVTMNDCDYLWHGGVQVTSTTFKEGEVDLVCPPGKVMEVDVYKNTAETEQLCTYTISPFTNKKANEFHNIAGLANHVTVVTAPLTGIPVVRHGSLQCGVANSTATLTVGSTTLKAFEDAGGTLSEGTVKNLVEGLQFGLTISASG